MLWESKRTEDDVLTDVCVCWHQTVHLWVCLCLSVITMFDKRFRTSWNIDSFKIESLNWRAKEKRKQSSQHNRTNVKSPSCCRLLCQNSVCSRSNEEKTVLSCFVFWAVFGSFRTSFHQLQKNFAFLLFHWFYYRLYSYTSALYYTAAAAEINNEFRNYWVKAFSHICRSSMNLFREDFYCGKICVTCATCVTDHLLCSVNETGTRPSVLFSLSCCLPARTM